jgi:formylglycine-generating enzyme required for sulfatase activity
MMEETRRRYMGSQGLDLGKKKYVNGAHSIAATLCVVLFFFGGCDSNVEIVKRTTGQTKLAKISLKARDGAVRRAAPKKLNIADFPIEFVFKKVERIVCENTSGRVVPWESSSQMKDLYLAAARLEEMPVEKRFTNSIDMEFLLIPAGTFIMGSPENEAGRYDDETQREVGLRKHFYMQTTEVTQGQWQKVMGNNPSSFEACGKDCPVEGVSWQDAQEFIKKLNEMEGTDKYRLPTEAEWEYVCRAGSSTRFSFGADEKDLGNYAWYCRNSGDETKPVARKKPNAWNLYDMHGNVWEWVEDDYHSDYEGAPDDGQPWIDEPRSASRVIRGGSWRDSAQSCRSAFRYGLSPGVRDVVLGFRLVRSIDLGP